MVDFDVAAPEGSRLLGADLGLRFGWGLLDHRGTRIGSGIIRFDRIEDRCLRATQIERRIRELVTTLKPTHVAYELVRRHEGVQAAHLFGGIELTVLRACHAIGLKPETVEVAAIKQAATGKGGAGKDAMIAAANLRWFVAPDGVGGDDEADGLWLAEVLRRRVAAQ